MRRWCPGSLPMSLAAGGGDLATAGFQPRRWATCKPVQRSVPALEAPCGEGTKKKDRTKLGQPS